MLPAHSIRLQRRQSSSGFTLLEVLITIALIGLLVGLVITNADKIFGQGQDAVAKVFVRDSMQTPLVRYRIDIGDYPSTEAGLAALLSAPSDKGDRWRGPYLDTPGGVLPVDPWGEPYQYRYPGTKNSGKYDLFSKGPDKIADTPDDIGNW